MAFFLIALGAAPAILGSWHGTSTCLQRPSPCHDERAVYEVVPVAGEEDRVVMRLGKVVGGQIEFFGTLDLIWMPATGTWTGVTHDRQNRPGQWRFKPAGRRLHGSLVVDGVPYRTIEMSR